MEQAIHEKHLLQMKFKEKFAFLYDRHSLFYYVIVLILVGLGFFGFALITQKFTTPYSGDFSQQYFAFEYNFYDDWWTFFKTGQFPFYDSNTFLGADNVISNTYYGLFSPFTFPILFFPRSSQRNLLSPRLFLSIGEGAEKPNLDGCDGRRSQLCVWLWKTFFSNNCYGSYCQRCHPLFLLE